MNFLQSDPPRYLDRWTAAFAGAFGLGLAVGLGTSGLPLIGALLVVAVLSLVSCLHRRTLRRAEARARLQTRSSTKILGE